MSKLHFSFFVVDFFFTCFRRKKKEAGEEMLTKLPNLDVSQYQCLIMHLKNKVKKIDVV